MNNKVFAKTQESSEFKLVDKLLAHQQGWQHYAFSVFVFNEKNELLLQKRASHKYHSPNLWTNTCCSHPLSANLNEAKILAENRLNEEMGFTTELNFLFQFNYNVKCNNNLIENEIDFVFTGYFNDSPSFNKNEVSDYKWININDLIEDVAQNGKNYTEWLKIILKNHIANFNVITSYNSTRNNYQSTL